MLLRATKLPRSSNRDIARWRSPRETPGRERPACFFVCTASYGMPSSSSECRVVIGSAPSQAQIAGPAARSGASASGRSNRGDAPDRRHRLSRREDRRDGQCLNQQAARRPVRPGAYRRMRTSTVSSGHGLPVVTDGKQGLRVPWLPKFHRRPSNVPDIEPADGLIFSPSVEQMLEGPLSSLRESPSGAPSSARASGKSHGVHIATSNWRARDHGPGHAVSELTAGLMVRQRPGRSPRSLAMAWASCCNARRHQHRPTPLPWSLSPLVRGRSSLLHGGRRRASIRGAPAARAGAIGSGLIPASTAR